MKNIFCAGIYIFMAFLSFGQDTQKSSNMKAAPTILFVCEHGAARSTIAAAYFNKLAQQQGLNYRAIFRGIKPDSALGPAAQKGLIKDGFDVHGWKPAPVTKEDIENAYQIVTLDCLLPEKDNIALPLTQWKGIPSISENYIVARDSVVKKVQALIVELSLKNNSRK
jgi:arsenate reductase (thioredoxin)